MPVNLGEIGVAEFVLEHREQPTKPLGFDVRPILIGRRCAALDVRNDLPAALIPFKLLAKSCRRALLQPTV
jgi:hypothetical protein